MFRISTQALVAQHGRLLSADKTRGKNVLAGGEHSEHLPPSFRRVVVSPTLSEKCEQGVVGSKPSCRKGGKFHEKSACGQRQYGSVKIPPRAPTVTKEIPTSLSPTVSKTTTRANVIIYRNLSSAFLPVTGFCDCGVQILDSLVVNNPSGNEAIAGLFCFLQSVAIVCKLAGPAQEPFNAAAVRASLPTVPSSMSLCIRSPNPRRRRSSATVS